MFHRLLKSVSMNMLNLFTKLSGLIFWLFHQPCKHLLFWFQVLLKIIMLRHSGCWYFDKMSFGQFGSGDDVIAGASVQRVRDWTNSGHTNATLKCYHQIFTLQLQCSTTSVEKCATLFMIMCKTVWCWKWNAIIALPMLCAEYTCPTMFFWAIGRDFLFGVYWTMFKAHCLLIPVVRTGSAHEFAPEELFSIQ